MVRAEGALGMSINQDCYVQYLDPQTATEAAAIPPDSRIVEFNGNRVTVRRHA